MSTTKGTPRKRLPNHFTLDSGAHESFEEGMCLLEASAYLAGYGEITDHPECVSPALGAFGRSWNDHLSDEDRQMLRPYARKLLNTNTGKKDDEQRAWMATDWLIREFAPAWLRLAGLTEHAEKLEALAPVFSEAAARAAQPLLDAAYSAAHSAASSARSAARSVARAAQPLLDAASSVASSAAYSAARSVASSAAYSAAYSAADSAARSALEPTVNMLQKSALRLLDRMIAVGQEAA